MTPAQKRNAQDHEQYSQLYDLLRQVRDLRIAMKERGLSSQVYTSGQGWESSPMTMIVRRDFANKVTIIGRGDFTATKDQVF